jgi:hypothetical protein
MHSLRGGCVTVQMVSNRDRDLNTGISLIAKTSPACIRLPISLASFTFHDAFDVWEGVMDDDIVTDARRYCLCEIVPKPIDTLRMYLQVSGDLVQDPMSDSILNFQLTLTESTLSNASSYSPSPPSTPLHSSTSHPAITPSCTLLTSSLTFDPARKVMQTAAPFGGSPQCALADHRARY